MPIGEQATPIKHNIILEGEGWSVTWPPNSPNLSPIEHRWDVLGKQVRPMEAPTHNLRNLC